MKLPDDYKLPVSIINKYKQGQPILPLAKEAGLGWAQTKRLLVEHGVELRDRKETLRAARAGGFIGKKFARENDGTLTSQVIIEYRDGESIKALSDRLGVTRETVTSFLVRHGQALRTIGEANVQHMSKRTPEQRKEYARAAQDAVRGVRWSKKRLHDAALRRQHVGTMTQKEEAHFKAFEQYGITLTPQFAVGRYNIDLACPIAKVAIEIDTGWTRWAKGEKSADAAIKEDALKRQNWLVIHLAGWPKGAILESLKDAVVIITSRRRRAEGNSI